MTTRPSEPPPVPPPAVAIRRPPAARGRSGAGPGWINAWPWLAAPLSGGLLVLCLAPWEQAWLCWFALAPLIAAAWFPPLAPATDDNGAVPATSLRRLRRRLGRAWRWRGVRCFVLGYLAGLVFFWGAFYWLTTVTVPGWFIVGVYMAWYPAIWSAFIGTLAWPGPLGVTPATPRPVRAHAAPGSPFIWNPAPASGSPLLRSRWNLWFAFLAAASWVGLEWIRGWLFSGFGWNDLGVALHGNLPFIQLAEWTGVGGLSFLAVFVNVIAASTVARFVLEVRAHRIRPHFDFTLTVAGLMLVFTFGWRTLGRSQRELETPGAAVPLRVAAVQAGIAQSEKWDPTYAAHIVETYETLTAAALAARPQLLLWPEAATPYGMYDARGGTFEWTTGVANAGGCNLLFGTLDYDFGSDGHSQADYNAAMMVTPGGTRPRVQVYRKIHLVPYGEYVPFRKEFPPIAWIVGDQVPGDFAFGADPAVFETVEPMVRVAPLICFEDALAELTRRPVLRGAQLLVNVTNDAWFGRTAASRQHFNEAVFRTVENRLPLVRCANTGVTAFVDRDGRVTQTLLMPDGTIFGQGILSGVVNVPARPEPTFYTQHGEIFSVACAAAAGLAVFLAAWRKLRRLELRRPRRPPDAASTPEP